MAAPPAESVEFGPRRGPIWVARIFGALACMGAIAVLVIAVTVGRQTPGVIPFLAIFGPVWVAFGAWMLFAASRMSRFRAVVTPSALRLVAGKGQSVWFQGAVAEAAVAWTDVQGFTRVDIPDPNPLGGVYANYVLYTKGGVFSLNSAQWENLEGLMQEVARRTGHTAGDVGPEHSAEQARQRASAQSMSTVRRVLAWMALTSSAILLLPLVLGLFAGHVSPDMAIAAPFLVISIAVAAYMIRFYRRR